MSDDHRQIKFNDSVERALADRLNQQLDVVFYEAHGDLVTERLCESDENIESYCHSHSDEYCELKCNIVDTLVEPWPTFVKRLKLLSENDS